jgi:hypothetical protein
MIWNAKTIGFFGIVSAFTFGLWVVAAQNDKPTTQNELVVHEWGTFTSLQDPDGQSVVGINTDDEPVPSFVHHHPRGLLSRPNPGLPLALGKSIPMVHPDVDMRMETPVMYFYPSKHEPVTSLDVRVDFHGGWLTEFYPKADVTAPGIEQIDFVHNKVKRTHTRIGRLKSDTTGSLVWKNLKIGKAGAFPKTDDPIWTTPRKVNSAPVSMPNGESEQYLFYRGVGNLQSPLQIIRDRKTQQLQIKRRHPIDIQTLWLVDVRADGQVAFRRLSKGGTQTQGDFEAKAYAPRNLEKLRQNMHRALVTDGLYEDEAWAMLNTWQHAYFQTPGMRLFYLLPQAWTDRILPLTLSKPATVKRTMVGRIELIRPSQEQSLLKIAKAKHAIGPWAFLALKEKFKDAKAYQTACSQWMTGKKTLEELDVPIPEDIALHKSLGRFGNAMVLHYASKESYKGLSKFAAHRLIFYYRPPARKKDTVAKK